MRRFSIAALMVFVLAACSDPSESVSVPATETETNSSLDTSLPATTFSTETSARTGADDPTPPVDLDGLAYELVAEMTFPMGVFPDVEGDRDLVITRAGQVSDLATGDVVLDLSNQTRTDGERGLLAALISSHETGSPLYAHYSDDTGATVVSRFARMGDLFDRDSEQVLFTVAQPASNHNGGGLGFADGILYLGLGDGGGANDQFQNGQNFDTLLGGVVEIDVETREARLWAGGLRNPWRIWIDEPTNQMIIADVGQGQHEEVSIVPLDGEFRNFGWPIMEGLTCFGTDTCDSTGLIMPVYDVSHADAGTCSITGGVTYWGQDIPEVAGQYFFSDLCGGWLRSIPVSPPHEVIDWTDQVGVAGQVVSFGTDRSGEIYVLTTERILKVVARR